MLHCIELVTFQSEFFLFASLKTNCYGSVMKQNRHSVSLFQYRLGSSEAVEDSSMEGSAMLSVAERQNLMQHRANVTVHVCWHRNTSVSAKDMHVVLQVCHFITMLLS